MNEKLRQRLISHIKPWLALSEEERSVLIKENCDYLKTVKSDSWILRWSEVAKKGGNHEQNRKRTAL